MPAVDENLGGAKMQMMDLIDFIALQDEPGFTRYETACGFVVETQSDVLFSYDSNLQKLDWLGSAATFESVTYTSTSPGKIADITNLTHTSFPSWGETIEVGPTNWLETTLATTVVTGSYASPICSSDVWNRVSWAREFFTLHQREVVAHRVVLAFSRWLSNYLNVLVSSLVREHVMNFEVLALSRNHSNRVQEESEPFKSPSVWSHVRELYSDCAYCQRGPRSIGLAALLLAST